MGKRYLELNHELLTKNSRASLTPKEYVDAKEAKAFEYNACQDECPVAAWEIYMECIKDFPHLFPKPSNLQSKKTKTKCRKNTFDSLCLCLTYQRSSSYPVATHTIVCASRWSLF